jgi:hypothetical protein
VTDLPANVHRVAWRGFAEISGGKASTTASLLCCENSVGTCFRLVHEPDSEAKRRAVEQTLGALRSQWAADDR